MYLHLQHINPRTHLTTLYIIGTSNVPKRGHEDWRFQPMLDEKSDKFPTINPPMRDMMFIISAN